MSIVERTCNNTKYRTHQFMDVQSKFTQRFDLSYITSSLYANNVFDRDISDLVSSIVNDYSNICSFLNIKTASITIIDINNVSQLLYKIQFNSIILSILLSSSNVSFIKEPDVLIQCVPKQLQDGLDLFIQKNTDYGDAFAIFSVIGVIMRLGDKVSRLNTIVTNNHSSFESVHDTIIDLYNYSVMAVMLINESKET